MAALMRRAVRPFAATATVGKRTMAIDAKVVRFQRFGPPSAVLKCVATACTASPGHRSRRRARLHPACCVPACSSLTATAHGAVACSVPCVRVETETVSEDLAAGQVLVRMVAAPMTPNDFSQVSLVGGRACTAQHACAHTDAPTWVRPTTAVRVHAVRTTARLLCCCGC